MAGLEPRTGNRQARDRQLVAHRKEFRLFWTWKSRRGKPGRPPVSREIRQVWSDVGGARIEHVVGCALGFMGRRRRLAVPSPSVSLHVVEGHESVTPRPSGCRPAGSTWLSCTNHAEVPGGRFDIQPFMVPTATFHLLFGLIVLHHERRQIVHCGVTANPTDGVWPHSRSERHSARGARRRGCTPFGSCWTKSRPSPSSQFTVKIDLEFLAEHHRTRPGGLLYDYARLRRLEGSRVQADDTRPLRRPADILAALRQLNRSGRAVAPRPRRCPRSCCPS